ncbi:MAG TPA: 3-isopropylmalate dehydratase [Burkholderiales bacterium]|nr:3-isopropylmalate dehydratase [Burkholderiales bacterium]
MKFTGKVWKFGDNINTDLILPNAAFYLTPEEQLRYIFRANRPGWVDEMKPGDIIIGGKNFGMGSSRPAARNLKNVGVACLVAESINGLFYRNSVNFAFPAMECPGAEALFEEGDTGEVDFDEGTVKNVRTGQSLPTRKIPPELVKIVNAGGIFSLLEKEGAIAPKA